MNFIRLALFAFLVFACGVKFLDAQDVIESEDLIHHQRIAAAEKLERERSNLDREALIKQVEQLTRRAATLRSEGNFAAAAEVDTAIGQACFENDPRLIRANDLKRRASASMLEGHILDADMYNREADRIFNDLESESFNGDVTDDQSRTKPLSTPRPKTEMSEIAELERQVQQLSAEMQAIKLRLGLSAKQLSQLRATK